VWWGYEYVSIEAFRFWQYFDKNHLVKIIRFCLMLDGDEYVSVRVASIWQNLIAISQIQMLLDRLFR
jgi:hypothetical protein